MLDQHHVAWRLEGGQALLGPAAQVVQRRRLRAIGRHDERRDERAPLGVGHAGDGDIGDTGMLAEDRLDRFDLGGVYDEIARELDDIVDEERHAVQNAALDARSAAARTGDQRRADVAEEAAQERLLRLDMLPEDLAGKVSGLQQYDFRSPQAEGRFEALLDRLRQQLATQMFEQVAGSMRDISRAVHRMAEGSEDSTKAVRELTALAERFGDLMGTFRTG